MKKIYFTILAGALAFTVSAQLTLTKAFNEPVIGNVFTKKGYDSTTVIPKNTGAGQSWNFTSLVSNTVTEVSTFTTVASTPSGSLFPSSTMAEADGLGGYTYLKSVGSNYEMAGTADATTILTLTNTAISAIWPISFGYLNADAYAGSITSGTMAGTVTGNIVTNAVGSGTVTMPGGGVFTNCLQAKITQTTNLTLGVITATFNNTNYIYFHGSQKFEIMNIEYSKTTSLILGNSTSCTIKVNNAVITGINEATFDKAFVVYPNPASGVFHVMFTNEKNENLSLEIVNNLGQTIRSLELGNANDINTTVNVNDLNTGVYYVKTTLGKNSVVKKLVIQ